MNAAVSDVRQQVRRAEREAMRRAQAGDAVLQTWASNREADLERAGMAAGSVMAAVLGQGGGARSAMSWTGPELCAHRYGASVAVESRIREMPLLRQLCVALYYLRRVGYDVIAEQIGIGRRSVAEQLEMARHEVANIGK